MGYRKKDKGAIRQRSGRRQWQLLCSLAFSLSSKPDPSPTGNGLLEMLVSWILSDPIRNWGDDGGAEWDWLPTCTNPGDKLL